MDSDGFRDRHHRYGYLVACENARRIAADPSVLDAGQRHLDRFSRDDPHQRDGYALWLWLFERGVTEVVARLTERSPHGDYIRETAPSFGGLPNAVRTRLLRERGRSAARRIVPVQERRAMKAKATRLDKAAIAHLIRAAAGVTGQTTFVIVGTGAVIAQLKSVPLDLMATREIEVYVPDHADADEMSTLVDGTLGEGSPFDETFGYFAHGVGERTACLPDDWRSRALRFVISDFPGVLCLCPEANDIGLSTICAFRDKDLPWLRSGVTTEVMDLAVMKDRASLISNPNAPPAAEIKRRVDVIAASVGARSSARFDPKP